jgi:chromosome segregation ATPase
MMRGSSGAAASDFDKALALIAGCAFPEETKARIAALKDATEQHDAALKVAREAVAAMDKERAAFDASQAERVANLDARERDIERDNEELNRRRALTKREDEALVMSKAAIGDDRKKFEAERAAAADYDRQTKAELERQRAALQAKADEVEAGRVANNERAIKLAEGEAALKARVDELNEMTAKFRVK